MKQVCLFLIIALVAFGGERATVCATISDSPRSRSREVKISGWLILNTHFGFYISESPQPMMCNSRWIFSRPGLIGLRVDHGAIEVSKILAQHVGSSNPSFATIEGRLTVDSVLVAPWRNQSGPVIYSPDSILVVVHSCPN